jgi:actin-related protein
MLMTALSQEAHDRLSIYYRLNDHAKHLDELGVPYIDIQPLMTEDFIVRFKDVADAEKAQQIFESVHTKLDSDIFYTTTADDNSRESSTSASVYYVDNRNDGSLYIQLKPSNDKYPKNFTLYFGDGKEIRYFEKQVSFVSIKNAGHRETGYFSDAGYRKGELPEDIYLNQISGHIAALFGDKNATELVVSKASNVPLQKSA